MIYGNVMIKHVWTDSSGDTLSLRASYPSLDYLDVVYESLLYSQIDASSVGLSISAVEMLTLDALKRARDNPSVIKLLKACGTEDVDVLQSLLGRGYKIFIHYANNSSCDRILLAKKVRLSAPLRRRAPKKDSAQRHEIFAP